MQAIRGYSAPDPAVRFGQAASRPQAPLFGAETDKAQQTGGTADKTAGEKKGIIGFFRNLWHTFTQQGVFQGLRQAGGVLGKTFSWYAALETANKDSSITERLLGITDIAYAQFREGYLAKNGVSNAESPPGELPPPHQGTFKLYAHVIQRFPLLAVQDDLPLDIVAKAVAASGKGEALQEKVDALRARHAAIPAAVQGKGLSGEEADQEKRSQIKVLEKEIREAFAG